jgi:hypothetical protein
MLEMWKSVMKGEVSAFTSHSPKNAYIGRLSGSPDYGDKLRCAIDAADPGAVPGSSTTYLSHNGEVLTGLN